jgi:adenylate cyclase
LTETILSNILDSPTTSFADPEGPASPLVIREDRQEGSMMRNTLARFGIFSSPTLIHAATIPSCTVCAGGPVLSGPLAAAGFMGPALVLHQLLWVFAPLNAVLLRLSFRIHRDPVPFLVGGLGSLLLLLHMMSPYILPPHPPTLTNPFRLISLMLTWLGSPLLLIGAVLDWRARRRGSECTPEHYWQVVLLGQHPGLRRGRHLFGMLPGSSRCKLCNAPFSGPFVPLMRLLGKARSNKNPLFCGDCLAKTPLGGAEIEVSLLFADVRGSTGLAERLQPAEFGRLLNRFYKAVTSVLVQTDALVDKFVGDEVIGLYLPGFAGAAHARAALGAAKELLRVTGHDQPGGPWLPIGVGVHTGTAFVGAVGSEGAVTDVTALGDAVNTAARLASMAGPGEILASEASCKAAELAMDESRQRKLQLKGRSEPVTVRVMSA